jgi:Tol biopolymer transport system component
MTSPPANLSAGARCRTALLAAAALMIAALPSAALGAPGDTEVVSVNRAGAPNGGYAPDVSAGGRFVAFESPYAGFVLNDTNGKSDVFVRDRQSGVTERVSVSTGGEQANGDSYSVRITPDGRYVLFNSEASNLVANDTNGQGDAFVRDRQTGVTELVTLGPAGQQPNDSGGAFNLTPDGRYVAITLHGTNVGIGDTEGQVFVRDRQTGTTALVSVNSAGAMANAFSTQADLSADGRFVVFQSYATNLAPNDTNAQADVFVRDRQTGVTERVSFGAAGEQLSNQSSDPSISADGRYVAFAERQSFLQPIFVRDRWTGTTARASVSSSAQRANGRSENPDISADGRYVVFSSYGSNLVPGDTNGTVDIFWHDLVTGTTEIESLGFNHEPANWFSFRPRVSPEGHFVGFDSAATNLLAGFAGSNDRGNVYLRETGGDGLTTFGLTVKPRSLAFGNQALLTRRTLSFRLRNTGTRTLSMPDPSSYYFFLRGRDASQFSLTTDCGASVAVGASCLINVTFRPTSIGDKLARLRVRIAGVDRTRSITGTGVNATP